MPGPFFMSKRLALMGKVNGSYKSKNRRQKTL